MFENVMPSLCVYSDIWLSF